MQVDWKRGPLAERDFRLLYLGQATSVLGDGLVPVALAFAVLDLTNSARDIGFVTAAQIGALVCLIMAGGVWADRLPRRLVMLTSDCVRGGVHAAIAVLLLTGRAELWHLIALLAIYGAADAFFQPAATGLLPSIVQGDDLRAANGLFNASRSLGFAVGPALAGVLVGVANPGVVFALDAGTFAVSVASLALLRVRQIAVAERRSFLRDLRAGWEEVLSRTWLWAIIAWATSYLFFVLAPIQVLGPFVAKESLGGPAAWGAIVAAQSVGMLAGGLVAIRWRPARPFLACGLLVVLEIPVPALLALRAPAAAIAVANGLGGLVWGLYMTYWATALQQEIPTDRLSRVSSIDWMGSLAFLPAGMALAGPVAGVIGIGSTLWVAAAWVGLSTAAVLAIPGVREFRSRAPAETAAFGGPSDAAPA